MITLREITVDNYEACMCLSVGEDQKHFVAENARSLADAAYLPQCDVLAVYEQETMIGMLLYDYDETMGGWSMSRFMIDEKAQHKGYGTQALQCFLAYFDEKFGNADLYTSAAVDNETAIRLYEKHGFVKLQPIAYEWDGQLFHEIKMVRKAPDPE